MYKEGDAKSLPICKAGGIGSFATPSKGKFITFEGGDGAGKSSVLEKVYKELQKENIPVIKTREPGGSSLGEKIRELLLHKNKELSIGKRAELLLFLAARAEHVEELILPALNKGTIVLCDRFHDSTCAYQASGRGLDEKEVENLCLFASNSLIPDRTLLFDIDPKIGLERSSHVVKKEADKGSLDRIEEESLEFHTAIRKAFLKLADQNKERFVVIDASNDFQSVVKQAFQVVKRVITQTYAIES